MLIAFIQHYSLPSSRLTALVCDSPQVTSFSPQVFEHSPKLTWLVPHETAAISVQVLCAPYNHAPCHFTQTLFLVPNKWAEEWVSITLHNYNIYKKALWWSDLVQYWNRKALHNRTHQRPHSWEMSPSSLPPPPSPHQLVPGYAS